MATNINSMKQDVLETARLLIKDGMCKDTIIEMMCKAVPLDKDIIIKQVNKAGTK